MPVHRASNVSFTVTQKHLPRAVSEERQEIVALYPTTTGMPARHTVLLTPPADKKGHFKGWSDSIKTFCRSLGNGTKTKQGNGYRYEVIRGLIKLGDNPPEEGVRVTVYRTENAMLEAKKQSKLSSNGQQVSV